VFVFSGFHVAQSLVFYVVFCGPLFKYSHEAFERLSKLTEFNTLSNIEAIKKAMIETIAKKRTTPPKMPIQLSDVGRLRRVSQKNRQRLSKYLTRLSSCHDSRTSVTIDEEEEEKVAFFMASMFDNVLNSVNLDSLSNASCEYLKLKVE
jgi:hypothetical protein